MKPRSSKQDKNWQKKNCYPSRTPTNKDFSKGNSVEKTSKQSRQEQHHHRAKKESQKKKAWEQSSLSRRKRSNGNNGNPRSKKKRTYKEVKPAQTSHNFETKKEIEHFPQKEDSKSGWSKQSDAFWTPQKNGNRSQSESNLEKEHFFLLIKNLGVDIQTTTVKQLLGNKFGLENLAIVKNSNNVYLKFESPGEIERVIRLNDQSPLMHKGKRAKMCLVNKLPLDLNQKSKICKAHS